MATATGQRRGASSRQGKAAAGRSNRSARKRSNTYLTNSADILTLANTLRKAEKAAAPFVEDGEITTIEDYATFVEQFSQQKCDRAIVMHFKTEGGDLVGCNFAFQDDPKTTTTSSYMVEHCSKLGKKLEQEGIDDPERYFNISSIEDRLGIGIEVEYEEEDEEFEFTSESRSHDRSPKSSKTKSSKTQVIDEDEDITDLEDLDELDDEAEVIPTARLPAAPRSPSSSNRQLNRRETSRASDEIKHTAERIAQNGQTLDGTNLIGEAAQVGHTVFTAASALRERQTEHRLNRIAEHLQAAGDRAEELTDRYIQLEHPTRSTQDREARKQEIHHPEAPLSETSSPDSFSAAANQVAGSVNRLGQTLDPRFKPLPPIQFDPNASLAERVSLLERQVQQIGERLDRLEEMISNLERQRSQKVTPASTPITLTQPSERQHSTVEPGASIERMVAARQAEQETTACAAALVNYSSLCSDDATQGIPLGTDLTLTVQRDLENNGDLRVFITDQSDKLVFLATQENGDWKHSRSSLSSEQLHGILMLPQTQTEYEEKANGQALLIALSENPTFQAALREHDRFPLDFGTYRFEVEKDLETNQCEIVGRNQQNQSVFEGRLIPDKAPDVRVNQVPSDHIEAMIQTTRPQPTVDPRARAPAPSAIATPVSKQSEL